MKTAFVLTFFSLMIFTFSAVSQTTIIINDPPKTELSDANKLSILPTIKDTSKVHVDFKYSIESKQFPTTFEVKSIKPATIGKETINKLYNTYIKVGFANYMMPYAQINYNSNRSKTVQYGVNLLHNSSRGKIKINDIKTFAGFCDNEASLFGKKILKKSVITGDFGFMHKTRYFYAHPDTTNNNYGLIPTEKDDMDFQTFLGLNGGAGWKSILMDSGKLNYNIRLNYNFLQDHNKYNEHDIVYTGDFNKFYNNELIGLNTKLRLIDRNTGVDSLLNAYLTLNPWIGFQGDKWKINMGLNVMAKMNETDNAKFHFYPNVSMQYDLAEKFLTPYVIIKGELLPQTYSALSSENPFINPNTGMTDMNNTINVMGGLKGSLSPRISYDFNVNYLETENMYFYVNSDGSALDDSLGIWPTYYFSNNRFNLVTDTAMIFKVNGALMFAKSEKLNICLKGMYNYFTLQNLEQPWQIPQYLITLETRYNIQDKILVNFDVNNIGPYYYKLPTFDQWDITSGKEKPHYDINLGFEYRYTKILSAFLQFNNLTAKKYQRWHGYQTYGFQVMFGLTYSL